MVIFRVSSLPTYTHPADPVFQSLSVWVPGSRGRERKVWPLGIHSLGRHPQGGQHSPHRDSDSSKEGSQGLCPLPAQTWLWHSRGPQLCWGDQWYLIPVKR